MRKLVFISFLLLASLSMQAQAKYAHINLGNLVSEMPAAVAANTQLEDFQKELIKTGEALAVDFQKDYEAFVKAVQGGTLTPVQQQNQQTALEKKQQEIVAFEQQIRVSVSEKRDELLQPIVVSAQQAIEDVAKENNIQLVFDTSIFGAIMFAAETEDIMDLVKAKLGM